MTRSIQADEGTVEVVHEALFREWKRLDSWIKSERPRLEALRTLERDAATWHRKSRDAAFLNHRDRRLMEAEALSSDDRYAKLLGAVEINHLEACRGAEQLAEQADRIKRQRTRRIVTILAVALFWGVTAWYYQKQLGDGIFWIDVWYHRLTPDRESALKPMATFKECSVCPKMIVVENGVFPMGSPDNEQNRSNTEGPQHDVTIARPFAVGKFDVTFAEWDACAAHGGCDQYMPHSSSGRRRMPVINVSWEFAKTYVAWLSEITDKTIGCFPRPNGNTLPAPDLQPPITGATGWKTTKPTAPGAVGSRAELRRSDYTSRINLDFTTWLETFRNGSRIAIITHMRERRWMVLRGSLQIVTPAYCAAAPGTKDPRSCEPLAAARFTKVIVPKISAFALLEHFRYLN